MIWLLPACLGVAAVSMLATGLLRAPLRRRAILDEPNERSSHTAPTPHGAGLAVVPIVLLAWLVGWLIDEDVAAGQTIALILIGAGVLAAVSWIDDLRHLPEWIRLAVQVAVVAVAMTQFGENTLVFQGLLPGWLDTLVAALAWIWFINLFNFMDGIDGMTGVESSCLGIGLAVLALLAPAAAPAPWLGLSLAAAALGFLVWNWHPARIFLGDVGSVPLGFMLGWLLLSAAANGLWAPALILPLYYLADATLTLCRR
ncbi:MAG: glycosyl transferase, partial [Alphaproteobacteria bacterium]|nr:glycosyl transferase [Alphaproteobacteria bacterium]